MCRILLGVDMQITQKDFKTLADKANNIYNGGCYLLCLLKALKPELFSNINRLLDVYDDLLERKYIQPDCYILNPEGICKYFGKSYKITKSVEIKSDASIIIAAFYNSRTDYTHFVLMNSDNTVQWDPLVDSTTVKEGKIHSYRIFTA